MAVEIQGQPQEKDRWQEVLQVWLDHQWLFFVGGILVGLLFTPLMLSLQTDVMGFLREFVPEAIGIVITVGVIERFQRQRDERAQQQREEQKQADELKAYQQRLIRDAGSTVHDVAVKAIEELRHNNWLEGENSLLQGEKLESANLRGATFQGVNLQWTYLRSANLQGASLHGAYLKGVVLSGADLQGAYLVLANLQYAELELTNLQGARLILANLQEAQLAGVNLQEADLELANLQWANLEDAKFDEHTRLPDKSYWAVDADMTRFTDPQHPNFWRPEPNKFGDYPWWYKPEENEE